ncbi:PspC domain-containing protein [Thalassotalea ganghwensis]
MNTHRRVLTRSKDGIVTGTLSGIAEHFGIRKNRLQFVFLILAFMGIGFFIYFILWICIPSYEQRAAFLADIDKE